MTFSPLALGRDGGVLKNVDEDFCFGDVLEKDLETRGNMKLEKPAVSRWKI
jgi:hypothetical protein